MSLGSVEAEPSKVMACPTMKGPSPGLWITASGASMGSEQPLASRKVPSAASARAKVLVFRIVMSCSP